MVEMHVYEEIGVDVYVCHICYVIVEALIAAVAMLNAPVVIALMTTGAFSRNILMTTGAFSRNVGKLFSELKLVTDNLLSIKCTKMVKLGLRLL